MNESHYISTTDVSKLLDVSVTTVKRWVDDGVLPAHKTVGGHRKILLADLLRLAQLGIVPSARIEDLAGRLTPAPATDPATLSAQYLRALCDGDATAAHTLLQGACHAGLPIEKIADEVVAPTMRALGHQWATGAIDVYQEHLGTSVCLTALKELKTRLAGKENDGPLAIGGCPEHDHYRIASLLAEMVLLDNGWRTRNFSGHTPLLSFARAIVDLKPRLLWLSMSYFQDVERFLAEYRELYRVAEENGVAVAVGGLALTDSIRARMPYTFYGDTLSHFAAFARSLHRPVRPPRRGRPPLRSEAG